MLLHWSPQAADDFTSIIQYIRERNPSAALEMARTISKGIERLPEFPLRGRPGRIEGTRELIFPSTPFLVVYVVGSEKLEIVRVLHSAQRWP